MKCINHPVLDAAGVCVKCGLGVCIECKIELAGKTYCQVCADVYSQLQPEVVLATCINQPNFDVSSVCFKCGKRISNDRKQELHNKTFCQSCANEIVAQEAEVALFLADIKKKKTGDDYVPRKEKHKFTLFKFILPFLPFLPFNPLVFISCELLPLLFRITRGFGNFDKKQKSQNIPPDSSNTSYRKRMVITGLLAGVVIVMFVSMYIVTSHESTPASYFTCGDGYSFAVNDPGACCQNGLPYYWSSDGICHTTLPPPATPTPTPTPTPSPCTLTVIYASDGGFTIPNDGTYQYGTRIYLRSYTSPGHVFDYWSGDASGTSPNIEIYMTSDKTIYAHFRDQ
jgi:uncharacterized repeat protein (TIGR02543 family)